MTCRLSSHSSSSAWSQIIHAVWHRTAKFFKHLVWCNEHTRHIQINHELGDVVFRLAPPNGVFLVYSLQLRLRMTSWHWQRTKQHTLVWKQEWRPVRNGCLADRARILFSVIVHSTSSSWMMTSFLRTFTANTWPLDLCSAIITCKKYMYQDVVFFKQLISLTAFLELDFVRHSCRITQRCLFGQNSACVHPRTLGQSHRALSLWTYAHFKKLLKTHFFNLAFDVYLQSSKFIHCPLLLMCFHFVTRWCSLFVIGVM